MKGLTMNKKPKRKRRRIAKDSDLYIDKDEMYQEMVTYNETGVISEKLGSMFLVIAQRFTSAPNYIRYSYRDEMICSAVARMVEQVDKFDITHESKNPFSYFTMVTYHCAISFIKKEKKYTALKDNLRTKIWDDVYEEEGIDNTEHNDYDPDEQFYE